MVLKLKVIGEDEENIYLDLSLKLLKNIKNPKFLKIKNLKDIEVIY